MSITFAYQDGAKSVDDFAAHRGNIPYAYLLYTRLGDLYVEKQRYQDAAATYRAFVSRDPVDEHAPGLTNAAIEAYRKGGFADLMLDGKLEYVQRYGFDAPFWKGREHRDYPKVVEELKTNLKDVAQYYHASAQKSKKPEDYAAAAHWYRAYLSSFPGDAGLGRHQLSAGRRAVREQAVRRMPRSNTSTPPTTIRATRARPRPAYAALVA